MRAPAIILFDGHCNFCQGAVKFVLPRDPAGRFRFASLKSPAGERLLRTAGRWEEVKNGQLDSLVLIEHGRCYTHSTAALKIARELQGAWKIFYAFMVLPRPLRDFAYRTFAKVRYRWFGRSDACMLPKPEDRERFLEDGETMA